MWIENQSLVFKCLLDDNATEHFYPRANGQGNATADDPYYDTSIPIQSVTADSVVVNVGISSNTSQHTFVRSVNAFTPTGASFTPGSGELVLTIAGHPFVTGDKIQIKDESIVFRCQQDSFGSDHAYPRKQDPASNNTWLSVTYIDANSFSVNVGTSSNTTTHNFQSAATGAIIRGVVKGGTRRGFENSPLSSNHLPLRSNEEHMCTLPQSTARPLAQRY